MSEEKALPAFSFHALFKRLGVVVQRSVIGLLLLFSLASSYVWAKPSSNLAGPLHGLVHSDSETSLILKLRKSSDLTDFQSFLKTAPSRNRNGMGAVKIDLLGPKTLRLLIPADSPLLETIDKKLRSFEIEFIEPDQPTFLIENSEPKGATSNPFPPISDPELDNPELGHELVVAVIDSGVDYTHQDLAPFIWQNPGEIPENGIDDDQNGYVDDVSGWNFANDNNDPMADDPDSYHGTHVAGVIKQAAQMARIGLKVKIMPVKFISSSGRGRTSNAIRAISYAVANGARILNNSWGSAKYSAALEEAIERAQDQGALFIAAAGNGDENGKGVDIDEVPFYPAAYEFENIVTVAASDENGLLTKWSNFGAHQVDLAAPGRRIRSTRNGNTYALMSGTSVAAPYVAGVAALMWSIRPELSFNEIRSHLLLSVDVSSEFFNKLSSSGKVNPPEAVRAVLAEHPKF